MADTMTPQEHYDKGLKELAHSATVGDTDPETSLAAAGRAQAHFLGGILSAVLTDLDERQEPGWEAEEALREHRAQNPGSGASPDGP